MQIKLPIIEATIKSQGELFGREEAVVSSVGIDSRDVGKGHLFVCIKGNHFDGHDFIESVIAKGAVAAVVERLPEGHEKFRSPDGSRFPLLLVDSAVNALGRIARYHRGMADSKVVGITGTAGKTTVKELLAQMLSQNGETARNPLNKNNQFGLPLSMLATSGKEKFWVMEAGISQPKDMDDLGAILSPDLALILNVGAGHVAGLGDRGVAHYKARFLAHLAKGGIGLVNADYPDLIREARHTCHDLIIFSAEGKDAPYRAGYLGPASSGTGGRYRLWLDGSSIEVEAPFRGSVGAENAIATAAVAHLLGLGSDEIIRGFAAAELPAQRFSMHNLGKWLLIDDTYNANPLSAERMVGAASDLAAGRNLVLVMGEMAELGEMASQAHQELGKAMGKSRAKVIFWKGDFADEVREGLAIESWRGEFQTLESLGEEFLREIAALKLPEAVFLFKGSRCNKLEELFSTLYNDLSQN